MQLDPSRLLDLLAQNLRHSLVDPRLWDGYEPDDW
jgi:hypothetical protein